MKKYFGYTLAALIGGVIFAASYHFLDLQSEQAPVIFENQLPVHHSGYVPARPAIIGPDFVDAAEITVNSVVHIKAELRQRNKVYNDFFDFFDDFFGNPRNRYHNAPVVATGSGVIISPDGYIVTNNHVVQQAEKLDITLNNGKTYSGRVIGRDPTTDLALVKIEENNLQYLTYGDSDDVKIGEWVLAVGNPFNLTSTVTAGIVSAKARNINILGEVGAIESFIQTDAVVNRGNSGGALVNTRGELVGINAAIASNTGSYTGYSFAIPVNIVRKVISDFIDFGEIQRAYLGITFREIDSQFAREKGLKDVKGVYVVDVTQDGSAKEAGMKSGDVIIQVDNSRINSKAHLLESIGTKRPGDVVQVLALRGNSQLKFDVTLRNRSGNTDIVKRDNISILGGTFELVTEEELQKLGIENGIKLADLSDGKLKNAGIRKGFIITHIDKTPISTVDQLKAIFDSKSGGTLIEGLYPNGQRAYYGIGL
jgi:serine protease Do